MIRPDPAITTASRLVIMSSSPAAASGAGAGAGGGARLFASLSALEERVMSESGVDDFEFVRYLGGGADGAVLLARNTRSDHPFKEKVRAGRGCCACACSRVLVRACARVLVGALL